MTRLHDVNSYSLHNKDDVIMQVNTTCHMSLNINSNLNSIIFWGDIYAQNPLGKLCAVTRATAGGIAWIIAFLDHDIDIIYMDS